LPEEMNLNVIAELPSSFGFPGGSRKLTKRLQELIPDTDILHCNSLWESCLWSAANIARKNNKPYLVSPHGMLDPWAINNSKWKKKIASFFFVDKYLHSAACIHALCESEYRSIRAYGLKNPVAIIPNGIDIPNLQAGQKVNPPWEPRVDKDKNVMLFLGRINPKKGLVNLVKAWSKVKPKDWVLAIAGWGQEGHESQLKRLVKDLRLEKDVVFIGLAFDEKKQACLQNADAFILPSFSEGLPMSILEAWSYKLPVLMTKECNIPEGFQAKAALEIRPESDSIVEGLEKIVSLSRDEKKEIGINGLELVKDKFAWPKIAAQMIDVYKWILGRSPKPECVRLS
jgi:poly(glycerol-phosphate) alpha-glucosyltransferase